MATVEAPTTVVLPTSSSPATLYTATAKCIVEVILVNVSAAAVLGSVTFVDTSNSNNAGSVCYQQSIAVGDGFVTVKKTLESGDYLTGYASAASSIHATANVVWKET